MPVVYFRARRSLRPVAEFERELIRDRVRSGIARVKATGRTRSGNAVGRPRREVDLTAVNALRADGKTWREIARALKVPRRTLERARRLAGRAPRTLLPRPLRW